VEKMDAQVGRIAEAVQYRQREYGEDWLLVVTTDHGRDAATGRHHGGQSERERTTWLVTNRPDLNGYARAGAPGIVDIMPTLARHLGVPIPPQVQRELDGVPLIGPVSLATPRVAYADGKLTIGWKALDRAGTVKVWLTESNGFSRGGKDDYRLLAEVPVSDESVTVAIKGLPARHAKIVLEGRHNVVTRWLPDTAEREANKQ
jgi:hypothetical protein